MALIVAVVVLGGLVAGAAALSSALGVRLRSVAAVAVAGVVGLVLLLGLVGVVGVGRSSRTGGDGGGDRSPPPTTETAAQPERAAPDVRRPDVVLALTGDALPTAPTVLDRLRAGDAPLVEVRGLLQNAYGTVRQCTPDRAHCLAAIPIRTDDEGSASVVVPLELSVRGEPCAPRCILVVDVDNVGPTAELVFGEPAPSRPSIEIRPASARPGDEVEVTITGLEPGDEVEVTQCSPLGGGFDPCGGRAPRARVVADDDGTASLRYEVVGGDIGATGGPLCRRATTCAIVVLDGQTVLAEPAALRIAGAEGGDVEGGRLAVGLTVAALLVAVAVWLVRTTDWRAFGLPSTTDDA